MNSFKTYHPTVNLIFFAVAVVFSVVTLNPILIAVSFAGAALYLCMHEGAKEALLSLGFYIPVLILTGLINPLFSHNGETILFFLNDQRVTLESILFALAAVGGLITVIYWCKAFGTVFTSDKFIYLFGRVLPKLSLILSMALRFIPLFRRRVKEIRCVQKTLGLYSSNSLWNRLSGSLAVFSSLITWALEGSLETAASMKSRGYTLKGRTSFSVFKFDLRDGLLAALILILTGFMIVNLSAGRYAFTYYPYISYHAQSYTFYIPVVILMFLPLFIEIKEELKWKYLISRI